MEKPRDLVMPELRKEWLLHNLALTVGHAVGLIHQLKENDEVMGILNDRGIKAGDVAMLEESLLVFSKAFYPRVPIVPEPR